MYRIAICDNEPQDLSAMEQSIKRWLEMQSGLQGRVTCYDAPLPLLEALHTGQTFDLYLLDILMPEANGIELGHAVRQNDHEATILYMTSSQEYALQAYGVTALRYFQKPVPWPELREALDTAFALYMTRPRHALLLDSRGTVRQVLVEDVLYIENDARDMVYSLRDGSQIRCSHRDASFEQALEPILSRSNNFIQPHKSFFVNMSCIREVQPDHICMDNGAQIPITRKRLTEVRNAYLEYASREGAPV